MGVGVELGRQVIPVVANECIVRSFYLIRRLAIEISSSEIRSISDMKKISWNSVKPLNNPTISRMLTIATGVFTTIDVGEAVLTQKYLVSINLIGVGRFAIAINEDVAWSLRVRNIKQIKRMYENIKRFAYLQEDDNIYRKIGSDMEINKLGLTVEQTEFLYNLEYYKTLNDIEVTKMPIYKEGIRRLKYEWLVEWKTYITNGFSSFLGIKDAKLHWYSQDELINKI